MNTSDTENTGPTRPFGYWLTAVDRLMAAEFDAVLESEHATRREWRLLNVVDGTAPARRPLNRRKLAGLIERGWVVAGGDGASDGWTLTDAGRDAKDRMGAVVGSIRAKVADAVSPDDLATTLASLEQIARAFGWDEETPLPRGRGGRGGRHGRGRGHHGFGPWGRHGFGPRRHHGFGPRHGFGPDHHDPDHAFGPNHFEPNQFGPDHAGPDHAGPDHGFGPTFHPGHGSARCHAHSGHADSAHARAHAHAHGEHRGHDGHRAARAVQHAYERGFDAGFSRGREA